jgi:hypothetical protein
MLCYAGKFTERGDSGDNCVYEVANYYSDKTVAENNARADKLFRQLRRFAVENRKEELDWGNDRKPKWYIRYSYTYRQIEIGFVFYERDSFQIYFDTQKTAEKAIETFKDELIWYFTEYKDSL